MLCLCLRVSILFKKDLDLDITNCHHTANGRLPLLNVKFNEKRFTLVNVYELYSEKERVCFLKD